MTDGVNLLRGRNGGFRMVFICFYVWLISWLRMAVGSLIFLESSDQHKGV